MNCVVLLSGGVDSATTLAIALNQKYSCFVLSFDYGQRHKKELQSAKKIVEYFKKIKNDKARCNKELSDIKKINEFYKKVKNEQLSDKIYRRSKNIREFKMSLSKNNLLLSNKKIKGEIKEHKIIKIDLTQIGGSALTDKKIKVPERSLKEIFGKNLKDGNSIKQSNVKNLDVGDMQRIDGKKLESKFEKTAIPITYLPSRNIIFLSLALSYAEVVNANKIFIGANAIDYSGYPDCRENFINAFEKMANLGTKIGLEKGVEISAPLINLTKAEIIKKGKELGVPYNLTWSCYKGGKNACGKCDSCLLRLKGFRDAGFEDEIEYERSG